MASQPPMLARPSFFALIVMPSASAGHLADDVGDRPAGLALLALVDEPGVLGEPAGVEEQRHAVPVADRADRPQVAPARPAGRRRSCW